jgi:hypothetical protein
MNNEGELRETFAKRQAMPCAQPRTRPRMIPAIVIVLVLVSMVVVYLTWIR